jgi:hypothetical protein
MADAPTAPRTTRPIWRVLSVLFVAGAAFAGSGMATCAYQWLTPARGEPEAEVTLHDTSSVVAAVRDLAVLESAVFHMERVIDLRERKARLGGLLQTEDALLLVAAADVVAGVDLGALREDDVRVDLEGRTAQLSLPPPRVLSARLDNARTYVHTRKTDALATREETLETRARQEAERALREAALEAGILLRARSSAARSIEGLVQSLGFKHVEVSFREE